MSFTRFEIDADRAMQGLKEEDPVAAAIVSAMHLILVCEELGLDREDVLCQVDAERGKVSRNPDVF